MRIKQNLLRITQVLGFKGLAFSKWTRVTRQMTAALILIYFQGRVAHAQGELVDKIILKQKIQELSDLIPREKLKEFKNHAEAKPVESVLLVQELMNLAYEDGAGKNADPFIASTMRDSASSILKFISDSMVVMSDQKSAELIHTMISEALDLVEERDKINDDQRSRKKDREVGPESEASEVEDRIHKVNGPSMTSKKI